MISYVIGTFRDDEELRKGEYIKPASAEPSKDTRFLFLFFSKKYASSKWCLNKLVKIKYTITTDDEDKKVLPVFYHVKPSEVGHQSGSFEDAFSDHEKDVNQEKEMIRKWRMVLERAAKLVGCHVDNQ